MKRQRLIALALVVCATIVVVAVAIIRHVSNKHDAAWCYDHGYVHYATQTFLLDGDAAIARMRHD